MCVFRYPIIVMWGWSNMGNSSKPALAKTYQGQGLGNSSPKLPKYGRLR